MAKPQIRIKGFDGEWCKNRLVDTVLLYNGLTYAPSDIREKGTLVLRSSNVQQDEITLTDNVYVNPSVVNSPFVQKGDIIVVVRNGSRELIGKHAQIKTSLTNCVIGAFMAGIRGENPEFVNALLSTKSFKDEVTKNLGATINQITNGTFRKMEFFFPQQDEQKAIGTYFRSLDALIQAAANKIDSLKQMKAACLQSMFPQPGETAPQVRFKGFTGDWVQAKLGTIFKERNEYDVNAEMLSVTLNQGVIKASENGRFDNSNNDKSHYRLVKIGDIAYNSMRMWQGASGCSQYEGIVSPAYTVVAPTEGIFSQFFAYLFKTKEMIKTFRLHSQGLTSDTWNLKYPAFSKISVYYPDSFAEQKKIASFFHEMDNQIRLHEQQLEKLKQIKASCLDKMFV